MSNTGPSSRATMVIEAAAKMSEYLELEAIPRIEGPRQALETLLHLQTGQEYNRGMPVLMLVAGEELK